MIAASVMKELKEFFSNAGQILKTLVFEQVAIFYGGPYLVYFLEQFKFMLSTH